MPDTWPKAGPPSTDSVGFFWPLTSTSAARDFSRLASAWRRSVLCASAFSISASRRGSWYRRHQCAGSGASANGALVPAAATGACANAAPAPGLLTSAVAGTL